MAGSLGILFAGPLIEIQEIIASVFVVIAGMFESLIQGILAPECGSIGIEQDIIIGARKVVPLLYTDNSIFDKIIGLRIDALSGNTVPPLPYTRILAGLMLEGFTPRLCRKA